MLFEKVRLFIESIGPVTSEVTKTQVSFGTTRKFAWVWLPQTYTKKRPEKSITLTFALGRHITHDRIAECCYEPKTRAAGFTSWKLKKRRNRSLCSGLIARIFSKRD